MESLILAVTYVAKKGMASEFLSEVKSSKIPEKIASERGFIRYDYYISDECCDEILLIEEWDSEEHQREHLRTSHMEKLKDIKGKYILSTSVEKFSRKQ